MDRPLRVVMPALTYVPGAMGGSETYARALVAGLDARDDVDLTVIVSRAGAGALGARSEHVVRAVGGGPSTLSRLATITRGAMADGQARALLRQADVVHYPFTVPVPRPPRATPFILTLHDVQHRDFPSMYSAAERLYRWITYDKAARRAVRVVTVSGFCRERITSILGIPAGLVDVVYNGVDLKRFHPSDTSSKPFVFYPATAWPHKNHGRLIDAIEVVRRQRPELRLVLTGGRRDALGVLPDWVTHQGLVSEEELAALYRSALCMVFPSLYEGFGLPPIEAMASGCPVAAARAGSLPEICGDAAVLFDPEDVAAIAEGVLTALDRAVELVPPGLAQAAKFTWDRCAEEHVLSYRRCVER